jgi:hypothetical protein
VTHASDSLETSEKNEADNVFSPLNKVLKIKYHESSFKTGQTLWPWNGILMVKRIRLPRKNVSQAHGAARLSLWPSIRFHVNIRNYSMNNEYCKPRKSPNIPVATRVHNNLHS